MAVPNIISSSAIALPSASTCSYYQKQMDTAEQKQDQKQYDQWKTRWEGGHCSSAGEGVGTGKSPGMLCNFKDPYYEECGLDENRYGIG